MSYAPRSLLDARAYVQQRTGLPWQSLGIVGDTGHKTGYHLGRDRIYSGDGLGDGDYSVKLARDRAGLTDAASALDVGQWSRTGLVALTAHLLGEARAGRIPDLRELIGPASDGRAYRWQREDNWTPRQRVRGDSHETHTHTSWYRDSEGRSKVEPFREFFEGGDDVSIEDVKVGLSQWSDEAGRRAGQYGRNADDNFRLLIGKHLDARITPLAEALVELGGQVAGLTALVQQLLTSPPVDLTPEQLVALIEAVKAAAREPGERIAAALAAAGEELTAADDEAAPA